jgi:hypothetical protein
MEADDILKYLLILLFLLPGLFSKNKKKTENRQQQPHETQYKYEDPFEDFKTFENDNVFSGERFEEKQNSAKKPAEYQQVNDFIPTNPTEEGISVFSQSQIEAALASIAKYESENKEIEQSKIKNDENDNKINDSNEFLNDFDMQQAVIYSEILSPKYSD